MVGDGVSIHDTNVVNTVHPLSPNIPDYKVPHILPILRRWWLLDFSIVLPLAFPTCRALPVNILGRYARARGWRPSLQVWRPHYGVHCDAPWWGRPFWIPGCSWLKRPPHSRINWMSSQVAWCHSSGRGDPSIPVPLTPSHWQLRLAPTATPPSTESSPVVGRPALMRQPSPLLGRYLPPPHVSVLSPPSPAPSVVHGHPTWIWSSHRAPWRGAPWSLMTPSQSPLRSKLVWGGQSQPVLLADQWSLSRGSEMWPSERGAGGIYLVTHPLPPGRPSLCPGWCLAQRPTDAVGTSAGPHMWSAGADTPPRPRWPLNTAILTISPSFRYPAPPLIPQKSLGGGSPSQFVARIPWRRTPPPGRSGETQPRCSWSSPLSNCAGALSPSSSQDVAGSPKRWCSPQRHLHTRTWWRRDGPSVIIGRGGGFPAHTPPSPVDLPGSLPPYWRGSDPSHLLPWSPMWPSGISSWMRITHHWDTHDAPPTAWLCGYHHWTHCTCQWGEIP